MRKAVGFLIGGALLLQAVGGCSRDNKSGAVFQEYVDDGKTLKVPLPPLAHPRTGKTADSPAETRNTGQTTPPGLKGNQNAVSRRVPVKALKPRASLSANLQAALGFAGRLLTDGSVPLRGEWWLGPAVGPAPTLATIRQVISTSGRNGSSSGRKNVSSGKVAGTTKQPGEKPLPRKVHVLIKEKTFRVEGPEGALRITYDDIDLLKVLNMDPVTPEAPRLMPPWLKNLHGKRVRIRGFMSPSFQQTGLRGFLLGRDNKACCFPGRAKVYDLFPVKMRDGQTTHYIQNRPFDVVGIFQIKPWIEDGQVLRLYQIVDAIVIE